MLSGYRTACNAPLAGKPWVRVALFGCEVVGLVILRCQCPLMTHRKASRPKKPLLKIVSGVMSSATAVAERVPLFFRGFIECATCRLGRPESGPGDGGGGSVVGLRDC